MPNKLWSQLLATEAKSGSERRDLERERSKLLALWSRDHWAWLTGVDTTTFYGPPEPGLPEGRFFSAGRPLIWTSDERSQTEPVKPFPDLEYLRLYTGILNDEQYVFTDKSRQMIISTTTLGYIDWQCRFIPARRWVLSKKTEDEAIEMLEDKVRAVHSRLPEWVQLISPQSTKPQKKVRYAASRSYILAANEAAAFGQARGGTASGVFVDEAAYQDGFIAIVTASLPMCDKLFATTTPAMGTPGGRGFKMYVSEGLERAA
jgi:hypothetical protein